MNNNSVIPLITLRIKEPAVLETFAIEHNIPIDNLLKNIRLILREHYNNFGIRPFTLEYSPSLGHVLVATSTIGYVNSLDIQIRIEPKVPNLQLGKCLGMCQYSKVPLISFLNKSLLNVLISDEADYSTIEVLAFSYFDSLLTIKNNGFARTFKEVLIPATKISGAIEFHDSISTGKMMPPIVSTPEPDLSVLPNKILKAAYDICTKYISNHKLKQAFNTLKDNFSEITELDSNVDATNISLFNFNIPRPDYQRALNLALSIINGGTLDEAGFEDYMPAFTMDMDIIFESFCSLAIKNYLAEDKFSVFLKRKFQHDTIPGMPGEIIPDIVIENKKTKKSVVLDTKNKYSALILVNEFSVNNADIYQICYYIQTLNAESGILIYPTASKCLQFPIRASESPSSYETKKSIFMKNAIKQRRNFFQNNQNKIELFLYQIDLSGSMQNTLKSIASLCLLIETLTD